MFTGTRAQEPADRSWCPVGKGDKDLWVGCADNGGCCVMWTTEQTYTEVLTPSSAGGSQNTVPTSEGSTFTL